MTQVRSLARELPNTKDVAKKTNETKAHLPGPPPGPTTMVSHLEYCTSLPPPLYLAMPVACGSSQAKDPTCSTGGTTSNS